MPGHDINIVHGVVTLYSIALYVVEWMHFIRNLWADKNNQNHQFFMYMIYRLIYFVISPLID